MLADFLAYIWPALPAFLLAGLCFVLAGGIWLVAIRRHELEMGPDPVIPPVDEPPAAPIRTAVEPAPNYHRSGEYPIVARIPGAGPVCPFCGGPFHPVCPSAPKERTDETVQIRTATEPALSPVKAELAPQLAALDRFFKAVDAAHADTDKAMHRIVQNVRPDCPLTTQDIPTLEPSTPFYDAAIRNTDTRELSEVWKKVSAP